MNYTLVTLKLTYVYTNPDAMCNIKRHSDMAIVLQKYKIVI